MFTRLKQIFNECVSGIERFMPSIYVDKLPSFTFDAKTNSLILNSDYNIVINAPNIIIKTSEDTIIISNKLHLNPPIANPEDKNINEIKSELKVKTKNMEKQK